MVIWVCAGGGSAEVNGLIPFLERNWPECKFIRKCPVRKPRRPGLAHGATGESLSDQIRLQIDAAIAQGETCQLILVLDDLDCNNPQQRQDILTQAMVQTLERRTSSLRFWIAFAAPEIEAWILADWRNTFGKDNEFRAIRSQLRYLLSQRVNWGNLESFDCISPATQRYQKLSELIIESVLTTNFERYYSKADDTSRLLIQAHADQIQQRCSPHFRGLYQQLEQICRP